MTFGSVSDMDWELDSLATQTRADGDAEQFHIIYHHHHHHRHHHLYIVIPMDDNLKFAKVFVVRTPTTCGKTEDRHQLSHKARPFLQSFSKFYFLFAM
jgi:hypothetical protein